MIAQAMLKSLATPRIMPFFPVNIPIRGPFRPSHDDKSVCVHPRITTKHVKYRDGLDHSTSTFSPDDL